MKHRQSKIKKLKQLSLGEWIVLLAAQSVLPLLGVSLRLFGVRRCQQALSGLASKLRRTAPSNIAPDRARNTARMVNAAASHGPYRAKCLVRSMTTQFLLACQGIDSELRIGVSKPDGEFTAHAWVVCQGRIINDRADVGERYQSFTSMTRTAKL